MDSITIRSLTENILFFSDTPDTWTIVFGVLGTLCFLVAFILNIRQAIVEQELYYFLRIALLFLVTALLLIIFLYTDSSTFYPTSVGELLASGTGKLPT